jgi:hypothetical protein
MATTEVSIANIALGNIGVNKFIAALDEQRSSEARICNQFYEHSRQYVLRDGLWTFAKRYINLTLVEEDPTPEWQFSYRYPPDCLLARYIVNPILGRQERKPTEYEIAGDDQGTLILTDMEDAQLCYTMDVINPGRYDQMFTSAFAWHLSTKIWTLSKLKEVLAMATKMYQTERDVALAYAYNEQKYADPRQEAEWIQGRDS